MISPARRLAPTELRRLGLGLIAALVAAEPAMLWACPTCKDALAGNPEAEGFAYGIFLSIIVMLGVLFGAVGFLIYKLVGMARRESPWPDPKSGGSSPGAGA
jgi:hypothetical protein